MTIANRSSWAPAQSAVLPNREWPIAITRRVDRRVGLPIVQTRLRPQAHAPIAPQSSGLPRSVWPAGRNCPITPSSACIASSEPGSAAPVSWRCRSRGRGSRERSRRRGSRESSGGGVPRSLPSQTAGPGRAGRGSASKGMRFTPTNSGTGPLAPLGRNSRISDPRPRSVAREIGGRQLGHGFAAQSVVAADLRKSQGSGGLGGFGHRSRGERFRAARRAGARSTLGHGHGGAVDAH